MCVIFTIHLSDIVMYSKFGSSINFFSRAVESPTKFSYVYNIKIKNTWFFKNFLQIKSRLEFNLQEQSKQLCLRLIIFSMVIYVANPFYFHIMLVKLIDRLRVVRQEKLIAIMKITHAFLMLNKRL